MTVSDFEKYVKLSYKSQCLICWICPSKEKSSTLPFDSVDSLFTVSLALHVVLH